MANSQSKIQKTLKPKLLDVWVSPLAPRVPKIGCLILILVAIKPDFGYPVVHPSQGLSKEFETEGATCYIK